VACWDGGAYDAPEDEREQQHAWEDAADGDLPWAPRHVDDPEPWKEQYWHDGPEYRAWKKRQQEEDDGA
jgi:hypothetical protein